MKQFSEVLRTAINIGSSSNKLTVSILSITAATRRSWLIVILTMEYGITQLTLESNK